MKRVSIKQLEERIDTINSLTNYKYDIHLYTTQGCGVDLKINGKYISEEINKQDLLSNKEAMEYLNNSFGKEIREIVIKLA